MPIQHDNHLIPWLKARFDLAVVPTGWPPPHDRWIVYKGDFDLDIAIITYGPSIFDAALEYAACYDGPLSDLLVQLELGEPTNKWLDLFGRPGLDQDCLERCMSPDACIMDGCASKR